MGAGVIASANTSPVEFHSDMVFVPLIQEDSAVFICGNLVGSTLDISRTYSHPDIFLQKETTLLGEELLLWFIFSLWL